MIVVMDTSVLIFLLEKDANAPNDPDTGQPVTQCYERVNHLISELAEQPAKIIIPTPALGEILVKGGGAAPDWLDTLTKSKHFSVAAFDTLAAVEYAALQAARGKPNPEPKTKMKFDDQIIAIARVAGANIIYSSDEGLAKKVGAGLSVIAVHDLPMPPEEIDLFS